MRISITDLELIRQIAERAERLYHRLGVKGAKADFIASEIGLVHSEVYRLRLKELLEADDGNFAHDISGIHRHLDFGRNRTVLLDCFVPRFAETGASSHDT